MVAYKPVQGPIGHARLARVSTRLPLHPPHIIARLLHRDILLLSEIPATHTNVDFLTLFCFTCDFVVIPFLHRPFFTIVAFCLYYTPLLSLHVLPALQIPTYAPAPTLLAAVMWLAV